MQGDLQLTKGPRRLKAQAKVERLQGCRILSLVKQGMSARVTKMSTEDKQMSLQAEQLNPQSHSQELTLLALEFDRPMHVSSTDLISYNSCIDFADSCVSCYRERQPWLKKH